MRALYIEVTDADLGVPLYVFWVQDRQRIDLERLLSMAPSPQEWLRNASPQQIAALIARKAKEDPSLAAQLRDLGFQLQVEESGVPASAEVKAHDRSHSRPLQVTLNPDPEATVRREIRRTELIRRVTEEEIYSDSIRVDAFDRTAATREIVTRARRANDHAWYPLAGNDQERVKAHIDDLLLRSDDNWQRTLWLGASWRPAGPTFLCSASWLRPNCGVLTFR